jgi:hypothetical protein
MSHRMGSIPTQTDWLTVSRNVTFRALASLHPDGQVSFCYFCYFCSLILHHMPATNSLDFLPHTSVPCPTYSYSFPYHFPRPAKRSFSGASYTPVLVSYWFTWWLCESPEFHTMSHGESIETEFHSCIFFLPPLKFWISAQPVTRDHWVTDILLSN